ncbi:alanine racemase [Nocardioides campestrisoli]|uniref:alanine racemase n=1 Tax=Nocardioides campestrisoli TaxID=2736757 RepID=UPI002159DCA2|nr:alanine racemase [Nocardioides campestrisoli]
MSALPVDMVDVSPAAPVGPVLRVDTAAVSANVRLLAGRTSAEVMAVVKADGFGHGAVEVARAALAGGATSLGVTSLAEALPLRAAGLDAPLLSWLNPVDADFATAVHADVGLAVPSLEHLAAITSTAPGARVHLHLDTGLARDGAAPQEWAALCRAARAAERTGRLRVVGVMGHLACADQPGHPANVVGRTRFAWGLRVARAAGLRPASRHLAATAATLTDPLAHHTTVRIGAGLVGIDPTGDGAGGLLRPAMTLTAPVVTVRRVRGGTPVGYGHTWTAPAATTLGLLPLGYADGLPRAATGQAEVLVRGRRRPVVGRISMDQVVVDLGDEDVRLGEQAVVFGPGDAGEPTVADWAGWSDTLAHEVVTGLGGRVHRAVAGTRVGLRSLA